MVTTALPNTTNVTLPTVDQIQNVDNVTVDISSNSAFKLSSNWLLTTSYYTKTANTNYSYYVWGVCVKTNTDAIANDLRTVRPTNPSDIFGARPVITTLKSNLMTE